MNLCISVIFTLIYLLLQKEDNFVKGIENTAKNRITTQNNREITHKLITIDINNRKSNEEYKYEYKFYKLSHTFIANEGRLIEKVTWGNLVLWDFKDHGNGYACEVYVGKDDKGENVFRVYFPTEPPRIRFPLPPESESNFEIVERSDAESTTDELQPERVPPGPKPEPPVYNPVSKPVFEPEPASRVIPQPESATLVEPEPVTRRRPRPGDKLESDLISEIGLESKTATGIEIQHIRSRHKLNSARTTHKLTPAIPKSKHEQRSRPELITLDIGNRRSTHEVDYEYDEKHRTHIFTPNKGYLIHDVMRKGKLMWECENGVYPEKVLIIVDQNGDPALRLQFPKEVTRERLPAIPEPEPERKLEPIIEHVGSPRHKRRHIVLESESEAQYNDFKYVDLDIDSTRSTRSYGISYFDAQVFGKLVFKAKRPFKFKHVRQATCIIWRAKDLADHAYKVIYDKETKTLLVFSFNGIVRKLKYNNKRCSSCNHNWQCTWTNVLCGVFSCMFNSKDKWIESGSITDTTVSMDY
ncbi:hypothetical protein MACJ_001679 [Theileria orientalis]|uniref:Uncharacterized protein n=1 Tax=Theileria orientalis TaxID=68886 RepID=A0A976M8Z8_THEOR|nr:hypothetical protein MACJ_001679 [Theileria orientalis]